MIKKKYKISFQEGLHARPAKMLVGIAKEVQSKIYISNEHGKSDAKSMLGIITLQAAFGTEVVVTIEGADEVAVEKRLEDFFSGEEEA